MSPIDGARRVKELAAELGFDRCGIAAAGPHPRGDFLDEWLAAGMAGRMGYLHRRRARRKDPAALLPGARSVIVVAMSYRQAEPAAPMDGRPRGRVAMYAWGEDYHAVIGERLEQFVARLRSTFGDSFGVRACVDTSPIIEREAAAAAGIGWIGKNTLVLHRDLGSFFFLGEIVTTLELSPDAPVVDRCGTCTRCLDACPTSAFPRPYVMDARRCISYLTIENRGEIEPEFHAAIGDWVFGCDICQQVCPYNARAPVTRETRFAPRPPGPRPLLDEIAEWDSSAHAANTTGSATERARLEMWRRNAAIARGNAPHSTSPAERRK